MKRAILIYNIGIVSFLFVTGVMTARTTQEMFFALLLLPMVVYFVRVLIAPLQRRMEIINQNRGVSAILPVGIRESLQLAPISSEAIEAEVVNPAEVHDMDRRLFLKLIGSAGMAAFMMSIFSGKASAAFFGSMPVPGTMALKNSAGETINPAEKQPTDGYEISEIDDADSPAYYGFVHKSGAWYISREETGGSYRYASGTYDFPTNWAGRALLSYDYFDNVF